MKQRSPKNSFNTGSNDMLDRSNDIFAYWGAADHHSLDILRVRAFARSEPKDVFSDYVEQEVSKGAFIQALCMPNPAYTVWHIRLGNDRVRKT
ncbi:hypothetical protein TNCV_3690481 [Trichonephila clavipes]|nr:hypothetical protein TNCV_3690481 [Trichonephila clavipes]